MRKIVDLGNDFVEAINFSYDDLIKFLSEIGIIKALGKQLGKSFDGDQRIANLVRHASGQIGPKCRPLDQRFFFAQALFSA